MSDDWRLANQMKYLYRKKLIRTLFERENEEWDHEHCQFCCDKISESEMAYATENKYYWICPECFGDFKEMFEWTVEKNDGK